jgi:hypothetical protein
VANDEIKLNSPGVLYPGAGPLGRPVEPTGNQGHCPQCGHSLIRGLGISVCENWLCESLPENIAPAASLEAWAGL